MTSPRQSFEDILQKAGFDPASDSDVEGRPVVRFGGLADVYGGGVRKHMVEVFCSGYDQERAYELASKVWEQAKESADWNPLDMTSAQWGKVPHTNADTDFIIVTIRQN